MKKIVVFLISFILILLSACGPVADMEMKKDIDIYPPQILGIKSTAPNEIRLVFNEKTVIDKETVQISPMLEITGQRQESSAVILCTAVMTPGTEYTIEATAGDEQGNSFTFMATCFGFNPWKPKVLINEFITQGSQTHPDIVELKVLADGDMGGLALYQGTASNWTDRIVFPSFTVKQGDFLLVHFKPEKNPQEVNETVDKQASGGLDASAYAYDFWVEDGKGISGNNGVLSLYDQPGGEIMDGVLYSNRTSASDELYWGFGSNNTKIRAMELYQAGAWNTSCEHISPEDGINPDPSTATRSICRSSLGTDGNNKSDWHIVPTSKASLGSNNCDEVYLP